MSTKLTLTPHESVEIRSSTAATLEVEVTYGNGGSRPPKHFHPQQDEHFQVLEGELKIYLDGTERLLKVGDEVEIPRGPHISSGTPARSPHERFGGPAQADAPSNGSARSTPCTAKGELARTACRDRSPSA